ncbi:VOC family protein [Tersicoccus sp. MR15.9]|uniref:VOC family protein n=1 Tax=Tersicoccus mangrovi TaxID=3121635 RepID=UPI002FE5EEA8
MMTQPDSTETPVVTPAVTPAISPTISPSSDRPFLALTGVVLDSDDPPALADFYHRLLGFPYGTREPEWVTLRAPSGAGLSFQYEARWVPPVWPAGEGDPAMMIHLDVAVHDLEAAVAFAERTGARLAEFQPRDDVRVMLDPAGHPFCLFLDGPGAEDA